MRVPLDDRSYLLVLTGAGISAESGVPTFRDVNGLWEGHSVQDVASPDGFARDPLLVWKFYSQRRANMTGVQPNAGHRALVDVEQRLGDRFLLVTQNVDGLHTAAGSERVVELHGNLMRSCCSRCDRASFEDRTAYREGVAPVCGVCQRAGRESLLRPDIVWFGEMPYRMDDIYHAINRADLFVSIGTSGAVYPAAGFVREARAMGALTLELNMEPSQGSHWFDEARHGPATELVPQWVEQVLEG